METSINNSEITLTLKKDSKRRWFNDLKETKNPVRDEPNSYIDELINGNILLYCGHTGNFNKEIYDIIAKNEFILFSKKMVYDTQIREGSTEKETVYYYYEVNPKFLSLI